MIIEKKANVIENYYNPLISFDSARSAFKIVLERMKENNIRLLLPAYIGWSSNEGSGIYDPVLNTEIEHNFYLLDEKLNIDTESLIEQLKSSTGKKAVLIVNYFGFLDINYNEIIALIKSYDAYIIEDSAHAFFTEFVDGICGKEADVVLYSLHKMFPCVLGGMARFRNSLFYPKKISKYENVINPFDYDLKMISEKRKNNARLVEQMLEGDYHFDFIRSIKKYSNCTPQTVPIIVKKHDKSDLYFKMNAEGFGVVSLYHTMILPLQKEYYFANKMSGSILNLPIHQDIGENEIESMCILLRRLCADD